VIRASKKNTTAAEFFTAGRAFTGPQNGIAMCGDYLSAASFLGIAGAIAVYCYDDFLYSIGFLVAWLVALLLVAELLQPRPPSRVRPTRLSPNVTCWPPAPNTAHH
jgi:cation/acetate symporter